MITLKQTDGRPIPFGALASLQGEAGGSGVVGNAGEAYLTGLSGQGELNVRWTGHACHAPLRLPAQVGPGGVYRMTAVCREGTGNETVSYHQ
nr:FimD/PapC C-terminal domain-containing protein [Rahnella ecdela]